MQIFIAYLSCFLAAGIPLFAQQISVRDTAFTLQDAVRISENNYPSIRAKTSSVKAASSNIKLQRQDLIPELDVSLQGNTATLNNTYGLMYTQNTVLPISGPVKNGNFNRPLWGSAAGILLSWQPLSFGERNAKINLGKATLNEANDDLANEIFNHDLLVIGGWLNYLTALAVVQTQQVNVGRTLSIYTAVKSLTNSGLRPGVDSFIVKGEISKANILLNKAVGDAAADKIALAELLGNMDTSFVVSPQNVLTQAPVNSASTDSLANHPLLKLYQSKIDIAHNELAVIKHEYRPRLSFFASSFTRGSGANIDGSNDYSLKGLGFSKYNYAIGAVLSFPVLQLFPNRTKAEIQQYNISSLRSQMTEQQLALKQAEATAVVYIQTAIKNYTESKTQLAAAEEAYQEMNVRYKAGLTTLPELFQVQYELTKAAEDDAIALITIWKAYLYYAQATGNINFFLNQVK